MFKPDRIGAYRGITFLNPVSESLKQVGRYTEYELMAAVVNASLSVFVSQEIPNNQGLSDQIGSDQAVLDDSDTDDNSKTEKDYKMEIGSGNILSGEPGDKIDIIDPKRPNVNFDAFQKAMAVQIGASIEVPADIILLNFQKSYSASRAALIEAWKFYLNKRIWTGRTYCNPIYENWFVWEILNNQFSFSTPGFFENNYIKYAWLNCGWVGNGQQQLDPKKETDSAVLRINNLLNDYESEYIRTAEGGDWRESMRRRAGQDRYLDSLNLSATATPPAPAEPIEPNGDEE
jgi:capsid protein